MDYSKVWLESWINSFSKPDWYYWVGFYPSKHSVERAKGLLNAINSNLDVDIYECIMIVACNKKGLAT